METLRPAGTARRSTPRREAIRSTARDHGALSGHRDRRRSRHRRTSLHL